jgi:hypothetical protein
MVQVRVESTITESNGSSSMASVCGGCLAMLDAGAHIAASNHLKPLTAQLLPVIDTMSFDTFCSEFQQQHLACERVSVSQLWRWPCMGGDWRVMIL